MPWRIIQVTEAEAVPTDLSGSELIGVSVLLTHHSGEPFDPEYNVYWRAREKIQPQVRRAIDDDS